MHAHKKFQILVTRSCKFFAFITYFTILAITSAGCKHNNGSPASNGINGADGLLPLASIPVTASVISTPDVCTFTLDNTTALEVYCSAEITVDFTAQPPAINVLIAPSSTSTRVISGCAGKPTFLYGFCWSTMGGSFVYSSYCNCT